MFVKTKFKKEKKASIIKKKRWLICIQIIIQIFASLPVYHRANTETGNHTHINTFSQFVWHAAAQFRPVMVFLPLTVFEFTCKSNCLKQLRSTFFFNLTYAHIKEEFEVAVVLLDNTSVDFKKDGIMDCRMNIDEHASINACFHCFSLIIPEDSWQGTHL